MAEWYYRHAFQDPKRRRWVQGEMDFPHWNSRFKDDED